MATQFSRVHTPDVPAEAPLGRALRSSHKPSSGPGGTFSLLVAAGLLLVGGWAVFRPSPPATVAPRSERAAAPAHAPAPAEGVPIASPDSLVQLAEEADTLAREQTRLTRALQDAVSRYQAKSGGRLPDGVGAGLTPTQRALLTERLESKRMGTVAVLQDLLAKDRQLTEVTARLQEVNKQLPYWASALEGQRHERLAMDYLRQQGLSTEAAYTAVSKASLQEPLITGFRVFLDYRNGEFATWVTQGSASISPQRVRQQVAELVAAERDSAVGALEASKADRDDLRNLANATDHALQTSRADLKAMTQVAEREHALGSSLRYVVGSKSELQSNKVLDKGLRLLPARVAGSTVSGTGQLSLPPIDPSAYGLKKVKRVSIVPGTVADGDDYRVSYIDGFLSIDIVRPDRFADYARYFVVVLE